MPASPGVQTSRRAHNNLVVSKIPLGKAIGASSFAVRTGDGAMFPGARGRVMLVQPAAYNASIAQPTDRAQCGIFNYASISGDTLSGVAYVSGANVNYGANCYVIDEWSDEDVADIWAAINALEAATTAANPPANTFYADSGGTNAAAFRAVSAGDISGLFAAGANVTVTPAGGVITIAASVSGGGVTGAAGRFSIADSFNGIPGAQPGLVSNSANLAANDAGIESAWQAAVAYSAATGRGAELYIPAGDWLCSLPIWQDQVEMVVRGDGNASALHQIGNLGPTGPMVVMGQARKQNNVAVQDDTYADANGVLDTSIAPSTYNWFGRRLKSASAVAVQAFYHITFPHSVLSAYKDYWFSCQKFTLEFAFTLNTGGTIGSPVNELLGWKTDAGTPSPWWAKAISANTYQFAFTTDDCAGTGGGWRTITWAPAIVAGLQRVVVMLDLAAGAVCIIHNGVVQTLGTVSAGSGNYAIGVASLQGGSNPPAFGPGLHFRRNDRGMPFQIGCVSALAHNPVPNAQTDITWYGVWWGDYRKYLFGAGGSAAAQDTTGGDAAATINDAFRYNLFTQNGRNVFYLDGSKWGPTGGTGYAGKPTKPCPQDNRLCPVILPGLGLNIGGVQSFGFFERDYALSTPLSGQGNSQNSLGNSPVLADLRLLPYWNGPLGTGPAVAVGTCYEPRIEHIKITGGFMGIGYWPLGAGFVNWVRDCEIDLYYDCAIYATEGTGEIVGCRLGTGAVGVLKFKSASYTVTKSLYASSGQQARAPIQIFKGNQPCEMNIERHSLDNEAGAINSEGYIWAEAGGQTRLRLSHMGPGTMHINAPVVYLAENADASTNTPGSDRLIIEDTILDNFQGRAVVVAEGNSWLGKIEAQVKPGKLVPMSPIEYCGPDGASFVGVVENNYFDAPPGRGLFYRNAITYDAPHKVDGFPHHWDVAVSGGWGASASSPRAAIPSIGFPGDPAGPPVFRPSVGSIVTPTGDELGAIGFPDDSIAARLTPDPTPTTRVYDYITSYENNSNQTLPLTGGPQAQIGRYSYDVHDAMNNYWLRGTAPTLPTGTVSIAPANRVMTGISGVDANRATVGAGTWTASSGGVASLAADVNFAAQTIDTFPRFAITQIDATRAIFSAELPGYYSPRNGDAAKKLAAGTGVVVTRKLPPYSPLSVRGSYLLWVWDAENNAWLNTGGTLASPPTDVYAGLCTIDLRGTGVTAPPLPAAILAAEATGGGYARAHVGLTNFNASSFGNTTNSAAITFATLTGPLSAQVFGVFLTDSASGAGTKGPFFFAQLIKQALTGTGYTGANGSVPSFAPGAFWIER